MISKKPPRRFFKSGEANMIGIAGLTIGGKFLYRNFC
jgi:hypothetical protein